MFIGEVTRIVCYRGGPWTSVSGNEWTDLYEVDIESSDPDPLAWVGFRECDLIPWGDWMDPVEWSACEWSPLEIVHM